MSFRARLPWRRRAAASPAGGLACVELVELVTEYLEGTLAPEPRARFEAHIGVCDHCGAYLEQMRLTLDVVGHLQPDDLDPAMERDLLAAFKDWKAGGSA
jgi:hypothetical protein